MTKQNEQYVLWEVVGEGTSNSGGGCFTLLIVGEADETLPDINKAYQRHYKGEGIYRIQSIRNLGYITIQGILLWDDKCCV